MGGFVLLSDAEDCSQEAVAAVFERKGLVGPRVFSLAGNRLLLWGRRSNGDDGGGVARIGTALIASAGTVVYRDSTAGQSLSRVLGDWLNGVLDMTAFRGAFAILIHDEQGTHLLTDVAGIYPVFVNRERTILTTSFLAAVAHGRGRHPVSRRALLEAIVTGSVSGPDTLSGDIHCLTREAVERGVEPLARGVRRPSIGTPPAPRSFDSARDLLVATCRRSMSALVNAQPKPVVGLGLSGGYDSRLLLALARANGADVRAHTFQSAVHGADMTLAAEVAQVAGISLSPIPVRLWGGLSDEDLSRNMDDALHYYDGRTNQTMGTFNDVHTRRIRAAAMGTATLGLNGLGGELFRNREHLGPWSFDVQDWYRYYVLAPGGTACFRTAAECTEFVRGLAAKYSSLCGGTANGRVDRVTARQIHARVWLPYSGGPRLAAENEVSPAAMPFAEEEVMMAALACSAFIGPDGRLEAAMIKALSRPLAACRSAYGHDFRSIPIRRRLFATAVGAIPIRMRIARGRRRALAEQARWEDLKLERSVFGDVRKGLAMMQECSLPLEWDRVVSDPAIRETTLYLANVLGTYRDRFEGCE